MVDTVRKAKATRHVTPKPKHNQILTSRNTMWPVLLLRTSVNRFQLEGLAPLGACGFKSRLRQIVRRKVVDRMALAKW